MEDAMQKMTDEHKYENELLEEKLEQEIDFQK